MPPQNARVRNYHLRSGFLRFCSRCSRSLCWASGAPMVRAGVARPVIRGPSVSHITAHGALLEASFNSVEGLWVRAAFVLRYSPCARCVTVRHLR